jgi:hypothetical protein
MIAVSDTGPLLYLALIECTKLLPQIFGKSVHTTRSRG